MSTQQVYKLPDGTVTEDAATAADQWAKAFYRAKDAILRIRNVPMLILQRKPVRNLDEIHAECDSVLQLGPQDY